jgi:hypothetical protein
MNVLVLVVLLLLSIEFCFLDRGFEKSYLCVRLEKKTGLEKTPAKNPKKTSSICVEWLRTTAGMVLAMSSKQYPLVFSRLDRCMFLKSIYS